MQTNLLFSELTTGEEANLSGGTYYEKKYKKEDEKKHGKKYEKDDEEKDYGYGKYSIDLTKLLALFIK